MEEEIPRGRSKGRRVIKVLFLILAVLIIQIAFTYLILGIDSPPFTWMRESEDFALYVLMGIIAFLLILGLCAKDRPRTRA